MSSRIAFSELTQKFITSGLYLRNWSQRRPEPTVKPLGAFHASKESQREDASPDPLEKGLTKTHLEEWIVWMRQARWGPVVCAMRCSVN